MSLNSHMAMLFCEGTVSKGPASPSTMCMTMCTRAGDALTILVIRMQLHNSSTWHSFSPVISETNMFRRMSYFRPNLFELITNDNLRLSHTFLCKLLITYHQFIRVACASILAFALAGKTFSMKRGRKRNKSVKRYNRDDLFSMLNLATDQYAFN